VDVHVGGLTDSEAVGEVVQSVAHNDHPRR